MDNRARLLSCALQLWSQRGYDAVGVQEIVDAAGVTKPTLYHYFGSKRGLLDTLLAEHLQELYTLLERAAVYQGDVRMTLERIARAYFEYARLHRLYYRMQLALWFAPPGSDTFRAVAGLNEQQQALLEGVFRRAAEDHGNMRGRHRIYAATFLGMIHTLIGLTLNDYLELNDDVIYRVLHQFMHGIFS